MKKALMILVSVALGATMASAITTNVVSKNTVGFYSTSFVSGKPKMQAMQFCKVGGLTNTLADLPLDSATFDQTQISIPHLVGPEVVWDLYTLQDGEIPKGWYNDAFDYMGDLKIPAGQGFWVIPSVNGGVSSGEVIYDDVAVSLVGGKPTLLGNPFPVELKLKDLPFNPTTHDQTQISIPHLVGPEVVWDLYTLQDGETPKGWYNDAFDYMGELILPVGQGFWLIPSVTGTITFTSPL